MNSLARPLTHLGRITAVAVAATLALSACGGSKGSSSSDSGSSSGTSSLPAQIKILSTTDLTGAAAFAGTSEIKGAQLAIDEINSQKFLGSSTISLTSKDTAGSATTAASLVSEGIADESYSGLLGTISSGQSVAVAPLVQAGKFPTIFTQSASEGTVLGEYTFRATTPYPNQYDIALDYLKSKGMKKLAVIYNSASPALTTVAEKSLPDNAKKYGYTITSSSGVSATTSDFTAVVSKALADKPDVVAVLLVGAANPNVAVQLRQGGFNGTVLSSPGASAGSLKPAGAAGNNWIWPNDFSAVASTSDSSKKFIALYKSKYNEDPLSYSAEAYDAIWMFAKAIKAQGKADRTSVQKGLDAVTKAGFDGAVGKVTFKDRDEVVPGVLIGWDATTQSEIVPK